MNILLILAFLFFIGSALGWIMELFFRRFVSSANPEKKWINPGFCTGPYVPLYGCGLCIMYLICRLENYHIISDPLWSRIAFFAFAAAAMTLIEYIAGVFCFRVTKVRLWDYSSEWGNYKGIICPKFSLIWAVLCAAYYFFIDPYILGALDWLSHNLAFSFFIGLFFGVFTIDVAHASQLTRKLYRFAKENDVIVRYESIKSHIRAHKDRTAQKASFFRPFQSDVPLNDHLQELVESFEHYIKSKYRR